MRERLYIASISEDAPAIAVEYGIGMELDHYCMAENMDGENLEQTDKQVRKDTAAVTKLLFHAPFNELSPAAIDPRIREIAYERYEQAYRLAKEHYGIEKMIVHSGYVPRVYYKSWHHERSLEFWKTYMKNKPDHFQICIENVMEDEPYMMVRLAEELEDPRIGLCLDIGHANCAGREPVKEWIQCMGPYITHLHIHNNNGKHDSHQALPSGTIDMISALELIDRYCPKEATVTIESRDGRTSLEWMDKEGVLK